MFSIYDLNIRDWLRNYTIWFKKIIKIVNYLPVLDFFI